MSKPNADQIARKMAARAARSLAKLEAMRAKYPTFVEFWEGSCGASVERSIARGDVKVIVAG